MKRLSREKRNQLIIVGVITLAVLGLIYFALIQPQYDSLTKIAKAKKAADNQLARHQEHHYQRQHCGE